MNTINCIQNDLTCVDTNQGQRHGFESKGGQILRVKGAENFLTPPLFGQQGNKILLR